MGNLGQADYAAANGFMDQFAAYRNRQVAAGQRHGRTLLDQLAAVAGRRDGRRSAQPASCCSRPPACSRCRPRPACEAFHRAWRCRTTRCWSWKAISAQMRRALLAVPRLPAAPRSDGAGRRGASTPRTLRREDAGVPAQAALGAAASCRRSKIDPRARAGEVRHRLHPGHEADQPAGEDLRLAVRRRSSSNTRPSASWPATSSRTHAAQLATLFAPRRRRRRRRSRVAVPGAGTAAPAQAGLQPALQPPSQRAPRPSRAEPIRSPSSD